MENPQLCLANGCYKRYIMQCTATIIIADWILRGKDKGISCVLQHRASADSLCNRHCEIGLTVSQEQLSRGSSQYKCTMVKVVVLWRLAGAASSKVDVDTLIRRVMMRHRVGQLNNRVIRMSGAKPTTANSHVTLLPARDTINIFPYRKSVNSVFVFAKRE